MGTYNGKPRQSSEGRKPMEDVILAKDLIRDIGGKGYVTGMISSACDFLNDLFPHAGEPRRQWTERRLWAWWNQETEVVRHWQMVELFEAARAKKEEQELIKEARNEHRKFLEKTAAVSALLERQDAAFHSARSKALGQQSRGMGRSRDQGDRG